MSNLDNLNPCGCCAIPTEDLSHHNPPGLSEIVYRIGKHAAFKRRMITQLPKIEIPDGDYEEERPLAKLTTRADDDGTIALLDAWASVADVLTFYQERIANEGFLRTATERLSVLELARAIGYELNPGVAASTYLAFTIDDSKGAPKDAEIPGGTQVQSLPSKKGELPQTFETAQDFTAHANWNALRPITSYIPSDLDDRTKFHLVGTNTQLKAGDRLLIDVSGTQTIRQIKTVKTNAEKDRTLVIFTDGTNLAPLWPSCSAQGVPNVEGLTFNAGNIQTHVLDKTWTESNLQAFLKMNAWDAQDLLDYVHDQSLESDERVFAFRERVGIFGGNAPHYKSLPKDTRKPFKNWEKNSGWKIWMDNVSDAYYTGADVYLDKVVDDLSENSWVVLRTVGGNQLVCKLVSATEASIAGFAMSAKVTGLNLKSPTGNPLDNNTTEKPEGYKVRKTTVYLQSEELELAPLPITDSLALGAVEITLDGMVLGLQKDQAVALTGELAEAEGVNYSEILTLAEITHCSGYTTLKFNSGLSNEYLRDTITLNANVIPATHGETVKDEILGSGDGAQKHQTFKLKKPPLTYTSAATSEGAESTLTVEIDNVKWEQVSSLYGLNKNNHKFIVRLDNEANAKVIFGDGKQGARLPTGQSNVVAIYRSGIGSDGEVGVGSLTLMKTRPFGAKSVTNPVKASGAADPETLDNARSNAPLTVLTMDRIVSLQDYEDFARAFAGVGKAQAAVLWNGERQVVHVTIADADGDTVTETSDLYKNLLSAMKASRNPLEEVSLGSYQPLSFDMDAKVLIDPAYTWEDVKAAIESELLEKFSFDQRAFGQPVTAAEVVSAIHSIDGVTAVDLESLHLTTTSNGSTATLKSVLTAHLARLDSTSGLIQSAELITINENGITLTEMKTI